MYSDIFDGLLKDSPARYSQLPKIRPLSQPSNEAQLSPDSMSNNPNPSSLIPINQRLSFLPNSHLDYHQTQFLQLKKSSLQHQKNLLQFRIEQQRNYIRIKQQSLSNQRQALRHQSKRLQAIEKILESEMPTKDKISLIRNINKNQQYISNPPNSQSLKNQSPSHHSDQQEKQVVQENQSQNSKSKPIHKQTKCRITNQLRNEVIQEYKKSNVISQVYEKLKSKTPLSYSSMVNIIKNSKKSEI